MNRRKTSAAYWLSALGVISLVVCCVSACGAETSSHSAESLIEHAETLRSEEWLVHAEIARAELEELPKSSRSRFETARERALRSADHMERECRRGSGLESCEDLESITKIVEEVRHLPWNP